MRSCDVTRARRIILSLLAALLVVLPNVIALPRAQAADPADINMDAKGSIVIHKYENPAWSGTVANGRVLQAPASAKPIQGVTFEIRRMLNIDIRRPTDWTYLTERSPGDLSQGANGPLLRQVTDASGTATFSDLPVGAYYVTETNVPDNVLGRVPNFIVTIPHPSQGEGGTSSWVYDVHVYPKNTVNPQPVKTVDDSSAFVAGDTLTWTIDQVIPAASAAEPLESITLLDQLPYGFTYKSAKVYINGTAYAFPVTHTNGLVSVMIPATAPQFTAGNTIRLEIASTASLGGARPNRAETQFRTKNNFNRAYSNNVTSAWAYIDILKVAADSGVQLRGAQFELYRDASCSPEAKVQVDPPKLLSHIWGDFPDPLLVKEGTYYLKEVTPPAGYLLPANNCMMIAPTAAENDDDDRPRVLRVENVRAAAPPLPATGANGELLLAIGGTSVVLAGIGLVFLALRRRGKN